MSDSRDAERWRRVDAILERVLEAPADERAAVLERECAGDADLRKEVESLVEADARAGTFLDPPTRPPDDPPLGAQRALLAVGQVLADRYRVEEHLGYGGMGAVYRAHDLLLDTDVAVKALDPDLLSRPGWIDALSREVRLARLVTHANVCRVHDLVADGATGFITMEYVKGESLAARLERTGPLPVAECVRVLTDVARGLAAAHVAGVVHRDLKPANVLLRQETGQAVVADFGIAAEAAGRTPSGTSRFGTRGYVAPEQRAGAAPDARSDLFSLGVLAQRIATGRLPDDEGAPEVPRALGPLVQACLRENPQERPRDANAAVRLLEEAAGRPESPHRRAALVALGVGAVAAVTSFWWRRAAMIGAAGPESVVMAAVDTTALDPADAWVGDALRGLVVNDLFDAWGLEARAAPAGSSAGAVRARVWRDATGRLWAAASLPSGGSSPEIQGGSLRDLAEATARWIAEHLVPPSRRHPTPQELREVGAHDPEAWRDFRRARRAARMELWGRVRALSRKALERDPAFPMAWLELDFSFNQEDGGRAERLDRAIALGGKARDLSPLSRLAIEFARCSRLGDEAAIEATFAKIGALPLEGADLLYVKTRLADVLFARGESEKGKDSFVWIAEKWPQDAAAPKKLADYYLGLDEPVSLPLALRYGQKAVALAPEDVAVRANLARAQLLAGDEAAARAQLPVIAGADPDDKQAAFLTERTNRLFVLHMALGDIEDATSDARRLTLEPGVRHAQGQVALATIDLARGAFDEGLAGLDAAAREFERLDMIVLAADAHWQHAWQAYGLERHGEAVAACDEVRRLEPVLRNSLGRKYAQRASALGMLARMETAAGAAGPAAAAALRGQLAELPDDREWQRWRAYLELLLRYRSRDWHGVVAAYRELEKGAVPLATTYYAAAALEWLGQPADAAQLYQQLATDPSAWYQPYRRGQAWLRLARLREQRGDAAGARAASESLLRLWDRAPRDAPEIREAQRRLSALGGS